MIHASLGPEHGLSLRAVEPADAEFILSLRLDPLLSRHVGDTPPDPEAQRRWIGAQRERPGDYYFICESAGRPLGTVGLYGISEGWGEWGRWVIARGVAAAPASALLVYRFAFETLRLAGVFCRTVEENLQVLAFHDRCGLRRAGQPSTVRLQGRDHRLVRHELLRGEWPEVEARLAAVAAGAARFLPGAGR